jgi:hypothetical protein
MDRILSNLHNSASPVAQTLSDFHEAVEGVISLANMKFEMTVISFSDSVFCATKYLFEAVSVPTQPMQSLISSGIPARIGVGFGSFAALRFRSARRVRHI